MAKNDIVRTVTALACTVVMSTACVLSAVGPAQASPGKAAVATVSRAAAPTA